MKQISLLPKIKKDIPKAIFILMLTNKKVFSKNETFLALLYIKKAAITIPKIFKIVQTIF